MFSAFYFLMGDFNGLESQGLLERTNLELLSTKSTRGTNVHEKILLPVIAL